MFSLTSSNDIADVLTLLLVCRLYSHTKLESQYSNRTSQNNSNNFDIVQDLQFFSSWLFWNICLKISLSKISHSTGISHLTWFLDWVTDFYVVTGVCCEQFPNIYLYLYIYINLLKDKSSQSYGVNDTFEKFMRPSDIYS